MTRVRTAAGWHETPDGKPIAELVPYPDDLPALNCCECGDWIRVAVWRTTEHGHPVRPYAALVERRDNHGPSEIDPDRCEDCGEDFIRECAATRGEDYPDPDIEAEMR